MFQIGGLIVFCGLLAQTTAQLEDLALLQDLVLPLAPDLVLDQSPTGLFENLMNALSNGLISQNLLGSLQNIPLTNILKNQGGLAGNLLGPLPSLLNIIDFKITDARLLQLGLELSPDGHRLYATIPLGLDLSVNLPLVGSLLKAKMDLNITSQVLAVTNELGKIHLVVGDCTNSPGSLDVTVLNGNLRLFQDIVGTIRDILTKVLPELVQNQACPVINDILSHLDVTLVHDIAELLIKGLEFDLTV
ncbi:BPI fold-containing family A member 1 isoform 1-T2 [Hipposideros larvatus]